MDEATTAASLLDAVRFDDKGLAPAIAQDALTGEVRMVAYVDRAALEATLSTGLAHFHSRSRGRLWKKGESSGHVLTVRDVYLDCDGDAVLMAVDPAGPTCHTGAPSCFFRARSGATLTEGARPLPMLERLQDVIAARASASTERSYTRSLLDAGAPRIGAKLREEADELARAIEAEADDRVANEAADVLYHLLVGLRHRSVDLRAVLDVLRGRFGVSGHDEKAARKPHA